MISTITLILKLLCGVALFLYGMTVMGDGLKAAAGNKLEALLYKLTNTPLKGILLGMVVTAIIQSSSATTVMVVGFVNSGMMKVAQAIGIVMGSNIGTSITGWILSLSYIEGSAGIASLLSTSTISAIVAIVGIIFLKFVKKPGLKHLGAIMLGFAVLMTGMQTMSGAMSPLKESPTFISLLTKFTNPFIGILIGVVFTAILQSASASVGILQALSVTGAITFASALPITMGIGVGAAAPVLLSSIGTNKNGKRTALVYLLNDLIGMVIWSIIFYSVNAVVGGFGFLTLTMSPVRIAILNSVYRILNISTLSPFIKQIEKLVFFIVKDDPSEKEEDNEFALLDERFLRYPDLALAQTQAVINGMASKTRKNIFRAMNLMQEYDEKKFDKVIARENLLDKYEDKLGAYLMQITAHTLSGKQSARATKFMHCLSDFERLGDHSAGLAYVAKELEDKKINFSASANAELQVLFKAIREIVDLTYDSFLKDDMVAAPKVEPMRRIIIAMCGELKTRHVVRLQQGKCNVAQGFPFNDVLTNAERIAAHCSNIAIAVVEQKEERVDAHAYAKTIKGMENVDFEKEFDNFAQKYELPSLHEIDQMKDAPTFFDDEE
ncbi:MAG: Na/Pi cotransporter family protein [Lachnospiraceae bacterium]|nr:Na/Pi cotransporter family protein [Lachnospiraceae bacterium]